MSSDLRSYKPKLPPYILSLCRQFRQNPTETESILWECLRNHRLHGYKFRRQHPIGRYIVDFYCHELRLVLEVDGGIHIKKEQKIYDDARQKDLESRGYNVLRITTEEVRRDLEGVLGRIIPSPHPLSPRERDKG